MATGSGVLGLHLVAMAQRSFARSPHGCAGQLYTDPRSGTSRAILSGMLVGSVTGRAFDSEEWATARLIGSRPRAVAEIAGLEQCLGEDMRPSAEQPVAPQAAIEWHFAAQVEFAGLSAHAASDALMLLFYQYLLGTGRDLLAPLGRHRERAA